MKKIRNIKKYIGMLMICVIMMFTMSASDAVAVSIEDNSSVDRELYVDGYGNGYMNVCTPSSTKPKITYLDSSGKTIAGNEVDGTLYLPVGSKVRYTWSTGGSNAWACTDLSVWQYNSDGFQKVNDYNFGTGAPSDLFYVRGKSSGKVGNKFTKSSKKWTQTFSLSDAQDIQFLCNSLQPEDSYEGYVEDYYYVGDWLDDVVEGDPYTYTPPVAPPPPSETTTYLEYTLSTSPSNNYYAPGTSISFDIKSTPTYYLKYRSKKQAGILFNGEYLYDPNYMSVLDLINMSNNDGYYWLKTGLNINLNGSNYKDLPFDFKMDNAGSYPYSLTSSSCFTKVVPDKYVANILVKDANPDGSIMLRDIKTSINLHLIDFWNVSIFKDNFQMELINYLEPKLNDNKYLDSTISKIVNDGRDESNNDVYGSIESIKEVDSYDKIYLRDNPTINIDGTPPNISNFSLNTTGWTKFANLTAAAQDTEGGMESFLLQYSTDNSSWSDLYSTSGLGGNQGIISKQLIIGANGYYRLIAVDVFGQTSTSSSLQVTNIDADAPILNYEVTGDYHSCGWYKGDAILKLTASDVGSGVKSITVNNDEVAGDKRDINVTTEGINNYTCVANDNVGNYSDPPTQVDIKVDKSIPINLSMTPNTTDWTKDPIQITVNAEDVNSGIDTIELQYTVDKDNPDWKEYKTESFLGANVANKVIPVTDNGYYRIIATDNVGFTETSAILKVDNYDPIDPDANTIGIEPNTIQWVNEPTGVEVTSFGSDELSGLNTVEVWGLNENLEYAPIKEEKFNGETTVESTTYDTHDNNSFLTNITDCAGNSRQMQKNEALAVDNIDPQAPELKIDSISSNEGYIKMVDGYIIHAVIEDSQSGYENAVLQKLVDGIWVDTDTKYKIISDTSIKNENDNEDNKEEDQEKAENDTDLLSKSARERFIVTAAKNVSLMAENVPEEKTEATSEVRKQGETKVIIEFTVRENGTYRLKGADLVQNTAYTNDSIEIKNLDGSMPEIRVEGNPTIWQNTDATLTVLATDADSKIAKMTLDGSNNSIEKNEKGEFYFTFNATKNQEFEVTASDEAGNTTTQTIKVTKIDKQAPILTTNVKKTWLSIFINKFRQLKVGGIDELSGIKKVSVKYENKENIMAEFDYDMAKSSYEDIYKIYKEGEYLVTITDHAGNVTTQSCTEENLDFSTPILKVEGNPTIWQNTDATITVTATDEDCNITEMTLDGKKKDISLNDKGEAYFTFTATKNQKFKVTASDESGNTTTQIIEVTKIDKEAPSLKTDISKMWLSMVLSDSRNLEVETEDILSGIDEVSVTFENQKTILKDFEYEKAMSNYEGNYKIYQEGDYIVTITDQAGNVSSQTISEANLDFSAPFLKVEGNPTIWQNTDASITVTAVDEDSNIAEMTLDGEKKDISLNDKGEAYFTFTATKNQEFKATAMDESGNITEQIISITKIDKEVPEITTELINHIELSELKYKGSDKLSGIAEITLKYKDSSKNLISFKYDQAQKKVSDIYNILTEGKYQVVIKDNAGNVSAQQIISAFEIIDPYPVTPEVPEVPTYPDNPSVPTTPSEEPALTESIPDNVSEEKEVKAEIEKKKTDITEKAKEKKHLPIAEILLGIAFFIIILFFLLCNVKVYCKTVDGEWKFLGKTRALKYKEIYLVKISKLVRIRTESDSYKLVFSKAFKKTHEECDLIVKIDDIDYERKLTKDSDTVYVEHK